MANETCLNCGKELTHFEGRRKKVFCSSTCKSINWYSKNKGWAKEYRAKKKKGVEVPKPKVNPPIVTKEVTLLAEQTDWKVKDDMNRIKVLEKELDNPPTTSIIGVKNWIKAREIELSNLKAKYNLK